MDTLARHHPRLAAGLWFGAAALFPSGALGVYYLLLLAAEGPLVLTDDLPVDAILAAYLVLLPLILAYGAGGLIGVRALRAGSSAGAAGWGALTGALGLLAWIGIGELLAAWLPLAPAVDAPQGVLMFGYGLAGLGSLALVTYGAVVGLWLWYAARGWGLEDTQPGSSYKGGSY